MTHRPTFFIPRPNPMINLDYLPRDYTPSQPVGKHSTIKHRPIGLFMCAISLCLVFAVGIALVFTVRLSSAQSSHSGNFSSKFLVGPCTCGCPSIEPLFENRTQGSARIINGDTALAHSWPWQLLLLIYDIHRQPLSYCGATLITDRHILTAAHCVHQHMPPFIFVFPGQHSLNISIHLSLGYPISRIYIHERYNVLLQHDLAILTVDQPFRFDSHTRPICLATPNSSLLQVNEELVAVGWGRVSAAPGTNVYARHLQQIKLPYLPTAHPNCSEIFRPITHIHPGQMCAGKPNHNACQGDSGGPLMRRVRVPQTDAFYWEQVGIASKTIDCGWNSTWPDIYINIPYYYDWIMRTIERAD